MADLRKAALYFYVWQPEIVGEDTFSRSYDCKAILQPGVDYGVFNASFAGANSTLEEKSLLFGSTSAVTQLSATVFFGTLAPWKGPFKKEEFIKPWQ
jgi:hypothetical protein